MSVFSSSSKGKGGRPRGLVGPSEGKTFGFPSEFIWAPWRGAYLSQPPRRGCIFCRAKRSRDDRKAHVIYRGRYLFCLLNRYPYNVGHLMVVVNRHVGTLTQLTDPEASELMRATRRMVQWLTKALRPHGFNLGVNLGRAAGAGIPGHLHLHVVPRWVGDTNVMPVVSGTKVLSGSLDALYERLRQLGS